MRRLYILQSLVLLFGTLFAWFTVFTDFSRFYNLYGNITRIHDCLIPNPITIPCFYGAFGFLIALIWSIYILRVRSDKKVVHQKWLFIFLIAGTIFAWSNLVREAYNFYGAGIGERVSCSGVATDSIFATPCFIGSALFLISLILASIIYWKNKHKN